MDKAKGEQKKYLPPFGILLTLKPNTAAFKTTSIHKESRMDQSCAEEKPTAILWKMCRRSSYALDLDIFSKESCFFRAERKKKFYIFSFVGVNNRAHIYIFIFSQRYQVYIHWNRKTLHNRIFKTYKSHYVCKRITSDNQLMCVLPSYCQKQCVIRAARNQMNCSWQDKNSWGRRKRLFLGNISTYMKLEELKWYRSVCSSHSSLCEGFLLYL